MLLNRLIDYKSTECDQPLALNSTYDQLNKFIDQDNH